MPKSPFDSGKDRAIRTDARAVKAYTSELRRMMGMEASAGKAATARSAAATQAIEAQNAALARTKELLGGQGRSLKNLDAVREKYHKEEMKRAESLASKYEGIKEFLSEIQTDAGDASTVLGTFTKGWAEGIDNLLARGRLPQAAESLGEVSLSANNLIDSALGAGAAMAGLGAEMGNQSSLAFSYAKKARELDTGMLGLSVRLGGTTDAARSLGDTIIKTTKWDMGKGVEGVIELATQLRQLEQNSLLPAAEGARFASERMHQVGISMEEAGREALYFQASADVTRAALDAAGKAGQEYSIGIRSDMVSAMMELHRQFNSQVSDLENVGAAYQWASLQAAKYGASSKVSAEVGQGVLKLTSQRGNTITNAMAGQRQQRQYAEQVRLFREESPENDVNYGKMSETQQAEVQSRIIRNVLKGRVTEDSRGAVGLQLRNLMEDNPLAAANLAVSNEGSAGGMESKMKAIQDWLGPLTGLTETSELLGSNFGLEQGDARTHIAELIQKGELGKAGEEISALREKNEEQTKTTETLQRDAQTALVSLKDPIQQLFNIKDLLKSAVMNVEFIANLMGRIGGMSDDENSTLSRIGRFTDTLMRHQTQAENTDAQETQQTSVQRIRDIKREQERIAEQLGSTRDEADRSRLTTEADALSKERSGLNHALRANARTLDRTQRSLDKSDPERVQKAQKKVTDSLVSGVGVARDGDASAGTRAAGAWSAIRTLAEAALSGDLQDVVGRAEAAGRSVPSPNTTSPTNNGGVGPVAMNNTPGPGNLSGAGQGEFSVVGGRTYIDMRVEVGNVGDAVAHAQAQQNMLGPGSGTG